jgi:hypothetical protein
MYPVEVRARALQLVADGHSINSTSKELLVSRAAIAEWLRRPDALSPERSTGFRCHRHEATSRPDEYAYLLGQYLGDGCLSRQRNGVFALRIACCDAYPGVMAEVEGAIAAIRPPRRITRVSNPGCTSLVSYSKHWPCLFPQHGPGQKHTRPIVLADWQREIVEEHPGRFLRGLFHSDGCRVTNWTVRTVAGQRKRYEYPRYFFTNASADIRGLCCWALDLLDIDHRHPSERNISVARAEAVAKLDEHVGPKS